MSDLRFLLWSFRVRVGYFFTERLSWWIAMHLPRKVALLTFVRVYASTGDCGPEYASVYRAWEAKESRH